MAQQSLKTKKNQNEGMKKIILTGLYCSIIMIILMSGVSAFSFIDWFLSFFGDVPFSTTQPTIQGTQHFEYSRFLSDNLTIQKFTAINYVPSNYDTITSGEPYQFYIWYHGNIEQWNEVSQNNSVQYCSLKVDISKGVSILNRSLTSNTNSTPYTIFQKNFTEDIQSAKQFVNLYPYDSAFIYLDCKFENPSERPNQFIIPMDYSFVAPTQECVACQYYEWATDQVTINKARSLGEYTNENVSMIYDFFIKFYELVVVAFWIFMILLVILAVGLMFFAIYWVFRLLYKYVRV